MHCEVRVRTNENERFSRYRKTIHQYWDIKKLQKPLWIYWCRKSFTDTGNYFPISVIVSLNREILDKCPFDVLGPLNWHGLTLIPAWISNHRPGKMWDEITYTFPNSKGVKRSPCGMDSCCMLQYSKWQKTSRDLVVFNLIPTWMSNYIHQNAWNKITYPFQNFKRIRRLGTWKVNRYGGRDKMAAIS